MCRRRGGFCYELNGLFRRLLAELGFSVSIASGRVYIASDDRFSPEFDHMVRNVPVESPEMFQQLLVEIFGISIDSQPIHTRK